MATITLPIGSMLGGAITAEMDINNANWRPSKIRVINNHAERGLYIEVSELGSVVWSGTAPAGETTSWNISGIQLGWQPDYWNTITEQYEPDGIDLGDYVISTRTV